MNQPSPRQNAFQRCYFAWAAPHYARMPKPLAAEAERIDRWLYSRAGLRFWLAVAGLVGASAGGLALAGVPWLAAVAAAVFAWLTILVVVVGAWLRADHYTTRRVVRLVPVAIALAYLGALAGSVVAYVTKDGGPDFDRLPQALAAVLREATPWMILMVATLVLLTWGVATVRRFRVQQEMHELRLRQERETTARQLAESRLKLLQRQLQPHFIFNTLTAVQHWVDQGDPRAGTLLRSLTSFLRSSTELLTQDRTAFAVEAETVRHYLSIMKARLGDRLRDDVRVDAAAAAQPVPPGLLLTLVENAIEHGIAPHLRGGRVTIDARLTDGGDWLLHVDNDGTALADGWQPGIGLANLRERLHHLFGDRASLALAPAPGPGAGTRAVVRIDAEGRS